MTQIDAEGQRCQTREPSAWFQPQFPHDEKDRERHQKDVDARKVPNDLEVGVVARKAALHGQIAECRDRIAGREHRDAERERAPPAPCRRVFDQIIGQHQIAGESRHIVERAVGIPVADAQNPRISVIARIAEHGRRHAYVRKYERCAPQPQSELQVAAGGLLQPDAQNRHDQVQSDQHVKIPKRRGVIVEIENERIELGQRGPQRMILHHDLRIRRRSAAVQINAVERGQRQRPAHQRKCDFPDPLAVKSGHAGLHGQQQYAGHHDEKRHAAPDRAPREHAREKCAAVGVELRDERVAAVRKHDQKAGQHAQQVDPA